MNERNAGSSMVAPSGISHFRREGHRIHLRMDESGNGLMTMDASRIVHLNGTAAFLAWLVLSEFPDGEAVKALRRKYNVGRKQAASDLARFRGTLESLLESGGIQPVTFMEGEAGNLEVNIREPFQTPVQVPYRMDLALTYRCNVNCGHCYNQQRSKQELSTEQWREIMRRLWDIGIPHVIFTGGEATLREDLPDLISFGESLGMVTGLLSNGVLLSNMEFVRQLVSAGLDHVQITLESHNCSIHNEMTGSDSFQKTVKAVENCLEAGLHTITNTTITRMNREGMGDTARFLNGLGLKTMAANTVIHSGRALENDVSISPLDLEITMLDLTETLDELGMRFIWYSPTRYCDFNPLEFSLGPRRCTAGQYNLCIEPDGEVLPCQSWYESAGNMLEDPWDSIWNSGVMQTARNRTWVPESCADCVHFSICGGGCALEGKSGAPCRDSM